MSNLNVTRPPQFLDPWFAEIEQVWDELEAAINDNDTRITALESTVSTGVVTSVSKSGNPQLIGDVTLSGSGGVVLTQVGNDIEFTGAGVTDHGALTGLSDDDHTLYLRADGSRSLTGDMSFGNRKALNFRTETLALDPTPGNQGRIFFNSAENLLKVDTGIAIIPAGVTDHGALDGLSDDDHTQYLLADGTRTITGNIAVSVGVTVDGRDISVDGTALDDHLDGTANQHDASEIDVEGTYANIPGTPTDLESTISAIDTAIAGAGVDNFAALTDTPANFTGSASKLVSVNVGETALEFTDPPTSDFVSLTDTPSAYAGEAGKIPRVNDAEDALEFIIQPNAALGGYQEIILEDIPTSNDDNTNTSYAALTGIAQQTFTTPVSGSHMFRFETSGYSATGDFVSNFRLVIDKGTAEETILGDSDAWKSVHIQSATSVHSYPSFSEVVSITAGEHTLDAEVKLGSAGILRRNANDSTRVSVQAQGSGINGLEVVEDTIASDFTTSAVYGETGHSVVVNTLEGERVQVSFSGRASQTISNGGFTFGYQVDSDAIVDISNLPLIIGEAGDVTFSILTAALNAGSHTIKLVAKNYGTGTTKLDKVNAGSGNSLLQVTRSKSFGIGAGTIETNDVLTADFAVTATSFADTGLEVPFTTIADEIIEFKLVCAASVASTALSSTLRLAYSLDGGPDVNILLTSFPENASRGRNISFSLPITITAAGAHTLKLRAKRDQKTITLLGNASDNSIAQLSVVQHRGGLIPVRDSAGLEVVEKPSALEFGNGAIVSAQGSVARIDFPNAALGGYQEVVLRDEGANDNLTSTSYAAIVGIPQGTFTTPVTGPHQFKFHFAGNQSGGTLAAKFRVVIDKGEPGEIIVGDSDVWNAHYSTVDSYQTVSFDDVITLSAGEHTFDTEYKVSANTLIRTSSNFTTLVISAQGSGINGLEVQTTQLPNDYDVTTTYSAAPGSGMVAITGLSQTVNTLEGEQVQVHFEGAYFNPSALNNGLVYGYQVDSDTPVLVKYDLNYDDSGTSDMGFTLFTEPLSAGQHTIKITVARISASTTPKLFAQGGAGDYYHNTKMQTARFKSFGIGAGTIVTEDTIPSDKITTSDVYEDTGLEVTFTAINGEDVQLQLTGSVYKSDNTNGGSCFLAYQLDGGPDLLLSKGASQIAEQWHWNSITSSKILSGLSGEHTVKIRIKRDGGTTWGIDSTNTSVRTIQHRGGLIPIQDDGVEIVDKPSALNFAGLGVVTTQSGSKALITISSLGDHVATEDLSLAGFDLTNVDVINGESGQPLEYVSSVTDGASAIGHMFNASVALSTAGALIISLQNNSVEKFAVDKDGKILIQGTQVLTTQQSAVADAAVVTTVGSNTGTAGAGLSLIGDTSSVDQSAALMNDLVALQEDILDIKTQLDAALAALRAHGIIAT